MLKSLLLFNIIIKFKNKKVKQAFYHYFIKKKNLKQIITTIYLSKKKNIFYIFLCFFYVQA